MSPTRFFVVFAFLVLPLSVDANIFDVLKSKPKEKRIKEARDIYKREFRKADSVTAFNGLAELIALARNLKDRPLECSVYDLQADYFSVNRGFNNLSPVYHQKAIDLAREYDLPADVAIHTLKKGMFYNTFKRYVEANRYFLEAYDLFKIAGFENVPQIGAHLHVLSIFYYTIGDLQSARNFVLEAIPFRDSSNTITMTNTLALIYQGLGDDKKALQYYAEALDQIHIAEDSVWVGIISNNIGSIYLKEYKYETAIPYLIIGHRESLKFGDVRIAAQALLFLAKCYLAQENVDEAYNKLKLAEPLVKQANAIDRWMMYNETMAQLFEKKEKPEIALAYWKEYGKARDSLDAVNNVAAVERVKLQWEMNKHQAQVAQLTADTEREVLRRNSLIAGLFLLMIISILIYNRQVLKRKKEKELFEKHEALLQSEQARTNEELNNATQALEIYTENLKQKNELIEKFKAEIEQLHNLQPGLDNEKVEVLEKLMQAHIMTDETWDEFKRLFDKVHNGFIFRLKEKFVQATETDIRLLTLVKLGLNTREMANMLGVTTEAIKKSRQRLKKKINLPEDDTLEEIVSLI